MDSSKRSNDTHASSILDGRLIRNNWPRMYPLEGFWTSPASSDPYVPGLRTNPDAYTDVGRGIPPHVVSRTQVQYECSGMPPPSDSGYSSRAKHSIPDTSVYDGVDRSPDTQSITGHMADFYPFPTVPSDKYGHGTNSQRDFCHGQWSHQQLGTPSRSRLNPDSSSLVCPTCHQSVKNRSEINKHQQRHHKPHKCDIPGCTRKDGFSTVNDLDRHKKSVHHLPGGVRYQCRIGSCSNRDKTWPRADNFRSHLKRVHNRDIPADGDLSEFLPTPPQPPALEGVGDFANYTADYATSGNGYWTGQRPTQIDVPPQHDLDVSETSPVALSGIFSGPHSQRVTNEQDRAETVAEEGSLLTLPSMNPVVLQSSTHSPLEHRDGAFRDRNFSDHLRLDSDPLIGSGSDAQGLDPDHMSHGVCEANSSTPHSMSPPSEVDPSNSNMVDTVEDVLPSPTRDNVDLTMFDEDDESVLSLANEEDNKVDPTSSVLLASSMCDIDSVLEFLKGVPHDVLDKFIKDRDRQAQQTNTTTPEVSPTELQKLTCRESKCKKTFSRQCELKKHLKRHDKPYGCTFRNCKKSFGSKNDWKRHENSQHSQLETWKCHEPDGMNDKATCSEVFGHRDQFKHHLQVHHAIQSEQKLETELNERRIGRDCDTSFWCGFCVQIIPISTKDAQARTERFNHIDDHFCGKNKQAKRTIADWKHIDDADVRDARPSSSSAAAVVAALTQGSRLEKKRAAQNGQAPRAKRQRV